MVVDEKRKAIAEAFVREALSALSDKPPSEKTVKSVAKKVAKALPRYKREKGA
jgi:hypothetical protein